MYLPSQVHHPWAARHRERVCVYTSPSANCKQPKRRGKGGVFYLLTPLIAFLRGGPLPLAPTLLLTTVLIPMFAVPPSFVPVVILVMLRRPMSIIPVPMVPRGPMTVVVVVPSMILPPSTIVVSVSLPFTVAITITVPFPLLLLVAVVTTTVTISVSFTFAVSPVLTVSIFFLFFLGWLLAFTAGGGPTVLRSFLLSKTFLLSLDKFREGGPTSFFVFKSLKLAQVLKEWYSLKTI